MTGKRRTSQRVAKNAAKVEEPKERTITLPSGITVKWNNKAFSKVDKADHLYSSTKVDEVNDPLTDEDDEILLGNNLVDEIHEEEINDDDELSDPETLHCILTMLKQMDKKMDTIQKRVLANRKAIDRISERMFGIDNEIIDVDTNGVVTDITEEEYIITLPLENEEALEELELAISTEEGAKAFKRKISTEIIGESLYAFYRRCVEKIFSNTDHYTWTGKSAYNAKHHLDPKKATDLKCVKLIMEVGARQYNSMGRDPVKEFCRALTNFNDAKTGRSKRRRKSMFL